MENKKNPPRSKSAKSPRKAGAERTAAIKRRKAVQEFPPDSGDNPRTSKRGRVNEGRPTKYQSVYAEQARKLALLGMSDKEMGDFFGVTEQTVNNWKHAYPEFFESLKAGKEGADVDVAASLYRAAIGGGTITERKEEADAEGKVIVKKTVKELPANVTAQIFWLKNRQPQKWRDKVVVEDETPPETLAQTADLYVKIMSAARQRQRQILIERGLSPRDGDA